MYKAITKRPLANIFLKVKAPRLVLPFSTSQPTTTDRRLASRKCSILHSFMSVRSYSTSDTERKAPETSGGSETAPDAWLSILENTVSSPWLLIRPQAHERILERAFTLIFQILLSLNVPRPPEAAQAFFFAFERAPVSPESEIGRGRRAVATLARVVIDDITSIPETSPLRKKHPSIFAIHGALAPLADLHLRDPSGNVEDWVAFWTRAESPLFQLNAELHGNGFAEVLGELLEAKKSEKKDGNQKC